LMGARPPASGCRFCQAPKRPELVGVTGGKPASVDVDLVVDELEIFLQLSELDGHLGAVGLKKGEPFFLVAGPGGDQPGVALDRPDRHTRGAQFGADADPLEVFVEVAPPAAGVAGHGGDNQASAFVVAQRMYADPVRRAASAMLTPA